MSLNWVAAMGAGVIGGTGATVVQILLWWVFTDKLPWIFYRDARLAAAILMGQEVLPPPVTFEWKILIVATFIHVGISIGYGLILASLIYRLGLSRAIATGSVYGLAVYVINMYGMTLLFPWFSAARDWITILTHAVFGFSVAAAYKGLVRKI
jgi:hypothetical protein